ncbi:hypothetical protein AB0M28_11160 [Streptomyces sp. NPDC051940]|uniref:hypothetical protein n=1 Tax=Streptomyces sp. NPDC051940 TaxID=3155675 RepID=UPI00342D98A4
MTRIGQAVMLHRGGDREEARLRLFALWAELGADAGPLHRCTLAHFLADTQEDAEDRLAWDLRALQAADSAARDAVPEGPEDRAVRAFYPSLHLSLAADHIRLRRPERARRELDRARERAAALTDDAYGRAVHAAIARLDGSLSGAPERP